MLIFGELGSSEASTALALKFDGDGGDGGVIWEDKMDGAGDEIKIGVAPVFRLIKDNADRHGPRMDQASEQRQVP